jgi:hypothetical protein
VKNFIKGILLALLVIVAYVVIVNRVDGATMAKQTPELFDSGVPRDESAELARYYADAAAKLKDIISNPPPGLSEQQREYRIARASELLRQVEQIRLRLNAASAAWVGKNVPQAYANGIVRADKQIVEVGLKPKASPFTGSFSVVDEGTVKVFARDTLSDLNKASDSMAARGKTVLRTIAEQGLGREKLNRILAGGVIEGAPVETIRTLRDELKKIHGETVPIVDKNGDTINYAAKDYAEMVARTQTRQATTIARHERLESNGVDLVSIVGRVSTNFCTAFLGQVFSLSGKSDKYPALSSLPGGAGPYPPPPFHPHCSKSTRPFVDYLANDKQLRDAVILADAKKLLGMDTSKAQRAFKDLQLHQQIQKRYATTAKELFASAT